MARENLPALGAVTCSSSGLSITPHAALVGGGSELQKARLFEPQCLEGDSTISYPGPSRLRPAFASQQGAANDSMVCSLDGVGTDITWLIQLMVDTALLRAASGYPAEGGMHHPRLGIAEKTRPLPPEVLPPFHLRLLRTVTTATLSSSSVLFGSRVFPQRPTG